MRVDKFTNKTREALQEAHQDATRRGNPELLPEHIVYALLTQADDGAREHTLRILTHITLQIDNQKAVAGSGGVSPAPSRRCPMTAKPGGIRRWRSTRWD